MESTSIEALEQQILEDPSVGASVDLASAHFASQAWDLAVGVCEQGLALYPHSIGLRIVMGKALMHLSRAQEAMVQFQAAEAIDKGNAHTHELVGFALLRQGMYRSAAPWLKKASDLAPQQEQLSELWELAKGWSPEDPPLEFVDTSPAAMEAIKRCDSGEEIVELEAEADSPSELEVVDGVGLDEVPLLAGEVVSEGGGLLGDLAALDEGAPPGPAEQVQELLVDIPYADAESGEDISEDSVDRRKSSKAARAKARSLEQERDALDGRSFFARHRAAFGVFAFLILGAGAAGGAYWFKTIRFNGETFESAFAKGQVALLLDTKDRYEEGIQYLETAQKIERNALGPPALIAYAHAMLFADYGKSPTQRDAARSAMSDKVRTESPAYALVVDSLIAPEDQQLRRREALLASALDDSVLQAHAGRVLLEEKKFEKALARLKKSIAQEPRQVIALVALSDYYMAFEDVKNAESLYAKALEISKLNAGAIMGQTEALLALGTDYPTALSGMEALYSRGAIPVSEKGRAALLYGEALAANRRTDEAAKVLNDALRTEGPAMAPKLKLALAEGYLLAGKMAEAREAVEAAVALDPKNPEALEALGRILIASGRERDVISQVKGGKGMRGVSLVRGIAYARIGDLVRAREELFKTEVDGKFPAEAVIYLALSDASNPSKVEKAIETLEALEKSGTKQTSQVQLALARIYLSKSRVDKARSLLEEAAKDPKDYEANALLGQLLLEAVGQPEAALKPLKLAVNRNESNAAAQHAYVRTLLALGNTDDAVKAAEAWSSASPKLEVARRDFALALLHAGKIKEAAAEIEKVPGKSEEAETWRIKAQVEFANGNATAIPSLQRAASLDTQDAATYCAIGFAYARVGSYAQAPAAFKRAAEINPQLPCGQAGPLHVFPNAKAESARQSPRDLLTALSAKSNDAWERAFLMATHSRVLLAERDLSGARQLAEGAISAASASPYGYFALGEVSAREKDDAKALEAFAKAVEFDKSWLGARLAFADELAKGDDAAKSQAIEEYEVVARGDQNPAEASRAKKAIASLQKKLGQ